MAVEWGHGPISHRSRPLVARTGPPFKRKIEKIYALSRKKPEEQASRIDLVKTNFQTKVPQMSSAPKPEALKTATVDRQSKRLYY